MKTVKQILEQNSYSSDTNSIVSGLSQLAECGLFDEAKLPLIKRGLTKTNINEMTEAEKKSLQYFIESLMAHVLNEQQDYLSKLDPKSKMNYPSEKDMPSVIILKRKAIRVYPDNQKVALYYSQALDKYVSIPFGPSAKNLGTHLTMNEERRTSIADLTSTQVSNLSPKGLERAWRRSGTGTDERTELAGKLGATQRSMVQGGNREAIKYAFQHAQHPSIAVGAAFGTLARAAFDKARGVRAMKPSELKGSVPSITPTGKPEAGKEAPWGPSPTQSSQPKQTKTNTVPQASSVEPSKQNVPVSQRSGAVAARDMTNRPIAKSFRQKLEEKRQEKIDEDLKDYVPSWEQTKSAAKSVASELTGAGNFANAYGKAKEGNYGDAAWEGIKGAAKLGTTIAGGALVKGAYTGAKAGLAGAELLSKGDVASKAVAAARGAAAGAGKTLPGRALKSLGRGAKGFAKGAANAAALLGGGGGGGSDQGSASGPGSDFRPADHLAYSNFGQNIKATVGGPPESDITRARRATIAYGGNSGLAMSMSEQTNFNKIRIISENKDMESELVFEDSSVTVNNRIAKKIMNLHESLNKRNKKKVEKMINEDVTSFRKVINFAVRQ